MFSSFAWFFFSEITKLRLQSAQDAARQVEMEVAERAAVLEEEHKAKLAVLHSEKQRIAELLEEIKHLKEEITKQKDFSVQNEKHLKEEMEKVACICSIVLYRVGQAQICWKG